MLIADLDQQNVLKDVVRGIADADLVIAELTSRNPNVLYELGVSHALRRNTVLITQSMDEVPFDLRAYRVLRYSTQFDAASKLSEQLEAVGKAHQDGGIDFGSPVIDFLPDPPNTASAPSPPTSIDIEPSPHSAAEVEKEGSIKPDENAVDGYLDAILALESANTQITTRMHAIGESTEKIGEHFQSKTQEVADIQAAGGPGMVASAHRVAGELGEALDQYAAELNAEGPQLVGDIDQLINAGLIFTAWLADQDDVDIDEAASTRDSLAELGAATKSGLGALGGFRSTLVELSGISRDMARGTGRAITALDQISGGLEQVEAFTEKAVDLLEERIPEDYTSAEDEEPEDDQRDEDTE